MNLEEKRQQLADLLRTKDTRELPPRAEPRPEPARPHAARQPMAIIGLAGRYPASPDLEAFWDNLIENRNCIREVGNERYDTAAMYGDPKSEVGKTDIRHFGLLDEIYRFDARFFTISHREAEIMDPHMRLLLETV